MSKPNRGYRIWMVFAIVLVLGYFLAAGVQRQGELAREAQKINSAPKVDGHSIQRLSGTHVCLIISDVGTVGAVDCDLLNAVMD